MEQLLNFTQLCITYRVQVAYSTYSSLVATHLGTEQTFGSLTLVIG